MRVLVVYYSYDGNTDMVAKEIAKEIHADLERLVPEEEKHHKGLVKYVWNGMAVVMKDKPHLKPFHHYPMNYDLIFLGTPVWAGQWAPAFNTFFEMMDLTEKKVAFFYCHAGEKGSIEKRVRKQLVTSSLLGFQGFIDPLWRRDQEKQLGQAKKWARDIVKLASEDKR